LAGLAIEILDRIVVTVVTVTDQGVNGGGGVVVVATIRIGTNIAHRVDGLLAAP